MIKDNLSVLIPDGEADLALHVKRCLAGLGIRFPLPKYELRRFIAPSAAMKQTIHTLATRQKLEFAFNESDLKYILADPVAEIARRFLR